MGVYQKVVTIEEFIEEASRIKIECPPQDLQLLQDLSMKYDQMRNALYIYFLFLNKFRRNI